MAHKCDLRCNAYQDKQILDMGNSTYILLSWKLFSGLEHLGHGFNENRIPIRQSTFSGIRKMVIQPSTFSLRWYPLIKPPKCALSLITVYRHWSVNEAVFNQHDCRVSLPHCRPLEGGKGGTFKQFMYCKQGIHQSCRVSSVVLQ